MGRVKTQYIKRIGKRLFSNNSDKFKKDFDKNKEVVNELVEVKSKKLRNVLAGYVTRLKEQEK